MVLRFTIRKKIQERLDCQTHVVSGGLCVSPTISLVQRTVALYEAAWPGNTGDGENMAEPLPDWAVPVMGATSHLSLLRFVFRRKCISPTLAESRLFIFRNGRQWRTHRRAAEGRSQSISPLYSRPLGHLYQEVAAGPAALSEQHLPPSCQAGLLPFQLPPHPAPGIGPHCLRGSSSPGGTAASRQSSAPPLTSLPLPPPRS